MVGARHLDELSQRSGAVADVLTCGDTAPRVTALSAWLPIGRPVERSSMLDVTQLRPFLSWARKRSLADSVLSRGETALTELSDAELRDLVELRPTPRCSPPLRSSGQRRGDPE